MSVIGLSRIFERYEKTANVLGVALGPKDPDDPKSELSVAFVVDKKKARSGARKRIKDGTLAIPTRLTVAGRRIATDVVEARAPKTPKKGTALRSGSPGGDLFQAGGPISNLSSMGTFGGLVKRAGDSVVYALTNRHVAIGPGNTMFFPTAHAQNAVGGVTRFAEDLVADERFVPYIDESQLYFRVDAALVAIPKPAEHRFSPAIPGIGIPNAVFEPDESSASAYAGSVIGTKVSSFSWNTGRREGIVSHVLYVTRAREDGPAIVFSMLIRGVGSVPSAERDSGKVWVTVADGTVSVVGLHQAGIALQGEQSRLAVATDFHALVRLLKLSLHQ